MRIHRYITETVSEGPGNRFVIWTQGCPIHCDGCYSPELQRTDGGVEIEPEVLCALIDESISRCAACGREINGLTLVGGEPFFQARPLAKVADHAREQGLNVITFSGYTYEYLTSENAPPGSADLLAATDVLIDGPFIKEKYSLARPMAGSDNQRFLFLTDRLSMNDFPENCFEIRIGKDGTIRVNGMGDLGRLMDALNMRAACGPDRKADGDGETAAKEKAAEEAATENGGLEKIK